MTSAKTFGERFAEVVLVGTALILGAAAVLLFFRRSGYATVWPILTVMVVLILAAVGALGLLKSSKESQQNAATAIVAGGFGLLLVELILASLYVRPSPADATRRQGVAFDPRTPLEVVKDLREDGVDVEARFLPFTELRNNGLRLDGEPFFPLSGISRQTTIFCNETGEYAIYESDPHGFNNPYREWPSTVDAILIGDSFTHGACVQPGEDIASHLRKTREAVLNLGMAGSGPLLEYAILREYGEALAPRFVFWIYYEGNDLVNLTAELASPLLRRYLEDVDFSQRLIDRQGEVDRLLKQHLEAQLSEASKVRNEGDAPLAKWRSATVRTLKLTSLRSRIGRLPFLPIQVMGTQAPPDPRFAEILGQARDQVAAWGGELVFVYLGDYSRYSDLGTLDGYYRREDVLDVVASLELPLIDLHPVLQAHPDPLSLFALRSYAHFNHLGYALVAEEMERFWQR